MSFSTGIRIACLLALAVGVSVVRAEEPESKEAQRFVPSEVMAKGDRLAEKRVTVEGVLVNEGTNYFTDRRLVLKDTSDTTDGGLPVKPWVQMEATRGQEGQQMPGPVLSDYLGKKVVLQGVLKEVSLKGLGKTKILEVESAKILD
jgi:hypothetical protein